MKPVTNIAQLPFVVASHPPTYAGLEFLSAVQLTNQHEPIVGIVDNVDGKILKLFVIDLCEQEGIDVEFLLHAVDDWYQNHRHAFPLSFYMSRLPIFADFTNPYKLVPVKNIIRIIGPVSIFVMDSVEKVRKKKHTPTASATVVA